MICDILKVSESKVGLSGEGVGGGRGGGIIDLFMFWTISNEMGLIFWGKINHFDRWGVPSLPHIGFTLILI